MNPNSIYEDGKRWMSRPFTQDLSIGNLLLIFVLFVIIAFIVWDMLHILKTWMDQATEAAISVVT